LVRAALALAVQFRCLLVTPPLRVLSVDPCPLPLAPVMLEAT